MLALIASEAVAVAVGGIGVNVAWDPANRGGT